MNKWITMAKPRGWYKLRDGAVARDVREGEEPDEYDEVRDAFVVTEENSYQACMRDGIVPLWKEPGTIHPRDIVGKTVAHVSFNHKERGQEIAIVFTDGSIMRAKPSNGVE